MDSSETWYSVKEFAASFGMNAGTGRPRIVSVDSVRTWIRRGILKAFQYPRQSKKGKRRYVVFLISETERQRFIRSQMTS